MKKFLPFFFEEFKSRFAFMVVEIATLKMFEKNLLIFCSFMKIVQEKRLREINEEIRAEREKGRSLEEIYKEIEEGLAKEKARRGK